MIISKDKVVTFEFELKDEDGNPLDKRNEPTVYLHGYRHILPLIEQALEGKTIGDKVEIPIPPEKAYGKQDPHLIRTFPIDQFPQAKELKVGMKVYSPENQALVMKVIRIEKGEITVDANHPLAGQTLVFSVKILAVRDASKDEILEQKVK